MPPQTVDPSDTWVPPDKFSIVEPKLFRCNFPVPANLPFIKLLGLKTVVNLSQEFPIRTTNTFFNENDIKVVNLGVSVWKNFTGPLISEELIKEALELLLDANNQPLMLMSSSGTHQVGVLIGCLRRLQGWNITSIIDEYRAFAAPATRYLNEQFIELWDVDLEEEAIEHKKMTQMLEANPSDAPAFKRHFFAVAGPLASPGVVSTTVEDDDD